MKNLLRLTILLGMTLVVGILSYMEGRANERQYTWLPTQLDEYAWFMNELNPWEMDDEEERTRLIITLDAIEDWIGGVLEGSAELAQEEGWTLSTNELRDIRVYAMGCVGPKEITWTHRISHALNIPAHELPHLLHTRLNAHCALVIGDNDIDDRQDLEEEGISQPESIRSGH